MSKIFTFGSNLGSQLGLQDADGSHIPREVKCDLEIEAVACGIMHTVLLSKGKVYTFGCSDDFALGRDGDEHAILEVKLNEKVVAISAGESHSACLTISNKVYAWGTFRDNSGVLGFNFKNKFMERPKLIERNVMKIASSSHMIVMLKRSGSVMNYGPDLVRIQKRKRDYSVLKSRVMERANKKVKINDIYAGSDQVFLITKDKITGYGNNGSGQLGNEDRKKRKVVLDNECLKNVKRIATGSYHTMFHTANNDLYVCGHNNCGQLGIDEKQSSELVKIAEKVENISCGGFNSLYIKNNKIYTFGGNYDGECGSKNDEHVLKPKMVEFEFGKIKYVEMGFSHTIVIGDDDNKNKK